MFGLLGEKLGHSYSKLIHEKLGYSYELIERAPEDVAAFLFSGEFQGLNVTIPYKKTVMEYCDEVSDLAGRIGAVNTIYLSTETEPGTNKKKLIGTNTDYEGLRYALERAGIDVKGKKVLVLGGTGGAGSMATILASDLGALETVVASRGGDGVHHCSYDNLPADAQIFINATPVGTYPNTGDSLIDLSGFKHCEGVVDLIYNPLRTELIMQARELGIKYTNGLPMLVRQATLAAGYFHYGREDEKFLGQTEAIIEDLERAIENIVLIGMPGCGKSSIGKRLAKRLGRELVDSDDAVKQETGKAPGDIIKESGEAAFRKIEEGVIRNLAGRHSLVIATGGGVPTRRANVRALKQNGRIFFIDRDPDKLSTYNRPLSQNGGVYKLYEERYDIYKDACDVRKENNGDDFTPAYENILKRYQTE